MSSGLRLRRPVFLPPDSAVLSVFVASLFAPSFFPSSVFLPVFRFSLAGPHFPLPVFLSVRVSLCPHLASFVGPSSFVCIPSGFSSVISCFSVHRPSLAACCPSPVAPSIVQRLPLVVRRPSRRASFRCRSVRITAFVSAESRPACLRELLAVSGSVGRSFRKNAPPPPYLGRRAVSDKITPCILLSGAIFPARPAILLTIWQRLPFGTTFVQIQGVTGAPDPQGGRIPAARKENGKNINN